MEKNKTVDEFISKHSQWHDALTLLRQLIKETELQESIKWGMPVYTINNKNVLGLGAFNTYVGIWFYQGVFLKDGKRVLINAQEGKTKGMRQWRFDSVKAIDENLVCEYLEEVIANQKAGKEIKPEKKPLIIPNELSEALSSNAQLSKAFDAMALTYKREYAEYILDAKREATKLTRLEKIKPMILEGIGMNDKYR